MDCIQNAVGLARCACPCAQGQAPVGWNTSASGLYIADLTPIGTLEGWEDCTTPSNPWTLLQTARQRAAQTLGADIVAVMSGRNKIKRNTFLGWIGQDASRETVTLSRAFAGLRIFCAPVAHGSFTLEKIGGVFDTSGNVSINVYNSENVALGGPYSISAVGGRHSEVTTNLSLPTLDRFGNGAQYFLSFQRSATPAPRAIKASCGCGSGYDPIFNTTRTMPTGHRNSEAWVDWLMVGGFEADNATSFDVIAAQQTASRELNGLRIHASLSCDITKSICNGQYNQANAIHRVAANALLNLSGIYAVDAIAFNPKLVRTNITNRDAWAEAKADWRLQYDQRVNWLSENIDVSSGGCMTCNPAVQMRVGAVLT